MSRNTGFDYLSTAFQFSRVLIGLCILGQANGAPEQKIVDGVIYHVLKASAESIRVVWSDESGNPLRTFPNVARYFAAKRIPIVTLMNGGIFEPGGVPSGLLIQDGKELRRVNRSAGEGNFFLKPNGIFLIGSQGAAVIRTEEYPLKGFDVQYAVQSGPLLLREGQAHPGFNANSTSRLHRNGVGVTTTGIVVLAMTDFDSPKFPNLFEFAGLFRTLDCPDALFLDGDLSQMRSGAALMEPSNAFGAILVVTQPRRDVD